MKINRYRVTVESKEINIVWTTIASNEEQAKVKTANAEGCPLRCITKVELIKNLY